MSDNLAAYWQTIAVEIQKQFNYPHPSTWTNSTMEEFTWLMEEILPQKCRGDQRKIKLCSLSPDSHGGYSYSIAKDTIRRLFKTNEYPTTLKKRNNEFAILLGAEDHLHFQSIHGLMERDDYQIQLRLRPELLRQDFLRATDSFVREAKSAVQLVHPSLSFIDRLRSFDLLKAMNKDVTGAINAMAEFKFLIGIAALDEYDLALAEDGFNEALRLNPESVPAQLGLVILELLLGNFARVLNRLKQPSSSSPLAGVATKLRFVALVNLGRMEEGLEAIQSEKYSDESSLHKELVAKAEIALVRGNISEAELLFEKLISMLSVNRSPDDPTVLDLKFNYARALTLKGKQQDAIMQWENLIELEKQNLAQNSLRLLLSRRSLASIYRDANAPSQVVQTLVPTFDFLQKRSGYSYHPASRSSLYDLCQAYIDMEDYPAALVCLQFSLPVFEQFHGPEHLATLTLASLRTFAESQATN